MFLARRMASRRRSYSGCAAPRKMVSVSEAELERMTAFPSKASLLGLTAVMPIQWFCFGMILDHPKDPFATIWAASIFGAFHLATIAGWIFYAVKRRKSAA